MDIYSRLERVLSRLKGRKYEIDRRIAVSLILAVMLRRLSWMLRGLVRTLLLQGRPKAVFIAPNVNLRNASLVHFGNGVTLDRGVIIDGLSTNGIRLGDNVAIGAYSIVCAAMLSHLGDGIQFGNNSSTGPYSFIGAGGPITIGENVIMGQHVSFHSENHNFDRIDLPIRSQGVNRVGILVEDDCWVGANVVFLDGAHVGRGSVVAAGAVVRGKIPAYSVVAGVPARVLRSRLPNEAPPDSLYIAASSS
jgi:acetyltransferase-like isoleucine patch superfamily enzyme